MSLTPSFYPGPDFRPSDGPRLQRQTEIIRALMSDGNWRSVDEIAELLHFPATSVSAQLRNLRKPQFGGYTVNRRRVGNGSQYRLLARPIDLAADHRFTARSNEVGA